MRTISRSLPAVLACALLLAGCEQLGFQDPAKAAAAKEAEGKAVGAACRHAGRAIEDCYSLNAKALKAAVFAGWKEMNDYMRENKIEAVAPQLASATPKSAKAAEQFEESANAAADDEGKRKPATASEHSAGKPADAETQQSKASAARGAKQG